MFSCFISYSTHCTLHKTAGMLNRFKLEKYIYVYCALCLIEAIVLVLGQEYYNEAVRLVDLPQTGIGHMEIIFTGL